MTYQRPPNLHESSYTTGEKIVGFHCQLLLLREALSRTTIQPIFYPDLFRALRVLIIDNNKGRLGELSELVNETHMVQSRNIVRVEPRDSSPSNLMNDNITFLRTGLTSLFLPNFQSRWFALRGVQTSSINPPITIDFWDYIQEDVVAFKQEFGAEITRKTLIAEVCNTRDVAHATNVYPTFLRFTRAFGSTDAPYFLEIGQEVAYEVLTFGRKVIEKCQGIYQDQISRALRYAIPIPVILCIVCHKPLYIDELVCPHCNNPQLPPPQPISLHDQLFSMFYFSRSTEMPTGSIPISINPSILTYNSIAEYPLVDITESNARMLLKRTSEMKLLWRVDHNMISHIAIWDLRNTPEEDRVVFFLAWSPERVTIVSSTRSGELWEASSDGNFRKLENGTA